MLLKFIGLFCKRALQKKRYSVEETYHVKEPTNHNHVTCGQQLGLGSRILDVFFPVLKARPSPNVGSFAKEPTIGVFLQRGLIILEEAYTQFPLFVVCKRAHNRALLQKSPVAGPFAYYIANYILSSLVLLIVSNPTNRIHPIAS